MDNEQQKDELSALESIYSAEEFSYHLINNNYEVISKVFIALPENYIVTYRDADKKNEDKQKQVSVSHLPPITLLLNLPSDYPSTSPPKFNLRSSWLSPVLLSKLCKKLDQLWNENKGQEILFTWIVFLQSEILEFLNIQKFINIDPIITIHKDNTDIDSEQTSKQCNLTAENSLMMRSKKFTEANDIIDERIVTDILNKNPVEMLIDYNTMRNAIEFKKNFYTCKICFSDKLGENCLQFLPCSHVFCRDCIVSYFELKIKDGTVMNIFCPEEKCKSEATPGQIKELVTPELFSKYDSMLLSTTLDTLTDIIYCPRKSCQYPVSCKPDEAMAECPYCNYAFCILCKALYHGVDHCKVNSAEKNKLIEEYENASEEKKKELEARYGKKKIQTLIENKLSEDLIYETSQCCPNCESPIEKSDGCNKMTCWKCNTFFCWLCRRELRHDDPYSHYRDPRSGCFGALFQNLMHEEDSDEYNSDENDEVVFREFH